MRAQSGLDAAFYVKMSISALESALLVSWLCDARNVSCEFVVIAISGLRKSCWDGRADLSKSN